MDTILWDTEQQMIQQIHVLENLQWVPYIIYTVALSIE